MEESSFCNKEYAYRAEKAQAVKIKHERGPSRWLMLRHRSENWHVCFSICWVQQRSEPAILWRHICEAKPSLDDADRRNYIHVSRPTPARLPPPRTRPPCRCTCPAVAALDTTRVGVPCPGWPFPTPTRRDGRNCRTVMHAPGSTNLVC
eukprot:SAG31_NODE_4083_length_3604_cov_3.076462_2_plen_149_part_00